MNEIETVGQQAMTTGTASMLMNPGAMEALYRFAEAMASSTVTVPDHLRGKVGDCMAVAMQAAQWQMNPFAVAQKTHVVSGRLGYEAQLVNAVVQNSGAIRGSFHYEFDGDGARLKCRVGAVLSGESEITWGEWLCSADVTTKNSPLWKVNPKQQLGYLQVKNWSRLYCPGAILGVYTPDELEPAAAVQKPATKHMGTIPEVHSSPSADLIMSAENAADMGTALYADWWKMAGKESRHLLKDHHERLKKRAADADAQAADADQAGWVVKIDDAADRESAMALMDQAMAAVGADNMGPINDAFDRAWTE